MKAMVLGAGLGTRLRPLTYELPKPAIPVLGKPVISYNMEFLSREGVKELVINLHRIPGIIKNTIARWGGFTGKIHYITEPDILGTGGGLKNAAPHFAKEKFFVIANSDTILGMDLKNAIAFHTAQGADATMVVFPSRDDTYTRIFLDGDQRLLSIGREPAHYEHHGFYTGLSILSPGILELLPEGKSCIIQDGLVIAKNRGMGVSCYLTEGLFLEFGTAGDYLNNTFRMLESSTGVEVNASGSSSVIPPVYISGGAILGDAVTIGPFASIEAGAVIEDGATVERSIVWGKGVVKKGTRVENSIVTAIRVVTCP